MPTSEPDPTPHPRRPLRRLRRALFLMALGLGGFGVLLFAIQRALLFPTSQIPPPPASLAHPRGMIRVDVPQPDGVSEGWLLPGDGVGPGAPGPLVIFGHGNGELIDYAAPWVQPYRALGVSVALLEYRGYGRSGGRPSEAAIVEDLVVFVDALTARPEVDPARVVYHGRSLGGGALCGLAARRPPRALILESTFRSVAQRAWEMFRAPRFLIRDRFDNEAVLTGLDVPVLIFHGLRDALVPVDHARRLAEVAPRARLVTFDCGHNDLPPDEGLYWREIGAHLRAAGVLARR